MKTAVKLMCWEFKKCGRDSHTAAGCSAFTANLGHACWRVAGTMCGGEVQGTFAEKLGNCKECDFYKYAKAF